MKVKEILNVLYNKQEVTITNGGLFSPTKVSGCVECMLEMLGDKVLDANVKSMSIDDDEATITWKIEA